jgi:hypothetical protein
MNNANKQKSEQLEMPFGTASGRLKKIIMLHLLQQLKQDYCFRCGAKIETPDELSIDHKLPWLHVSVDLFWDIKNIAFSHLTCNSLAGKRTTGVESKGGNKHGTSHRYGNHGCRCDLCREAKVISNKKYKT